MKVANAPQTIIAAPPVRSKETSSANPTSSDSYVRSQGSQAKENFITTAGLALAAGGIAAVTTAFVPGGTGFSHAVKSLVFAGVAGAGGALAGGMLGDKIGSFAEMKAGTSHSADESMGNSIGGLIVGAGSGLVAAVGSSFFGEGPVTAAVTAIAVVGVGGLAIGLLDKLHK